MTSLNEAEISDTEPSSRISQLVLTIIQQSLPGVSLPARKVRGIQRAIFQKKKADWQAVKRSLIKDLPATQLDNVHFLLNNLKALQGLAKEHQFSSFEELELWMDGHQKKHLELFVGKRSKLPFSHFF